MTFPGGVLRDVGDPELVRSWAGEGAVDQVTGGLLSRQDPALPTPGQALEAGPLRQHRHGSVPDRDRAAKPQFGVNPKGTRRSLARLDGSPRSIQSATDAGSPSAMQIANAMRRSPTPTLPGLCTPP